MPDDRPTPHRPRATPHERVWRAPERPEGQEGEGARHGPLQRQGAAATALHVDDPELARVRRLLADLRPDCPNPWEPPVRAVEMTPGVAPPRDPSASWGGIPRGLFGERDAVEESERRCLADVLEELRALPADAAAVLRWVRERASLEVGLRGLYSDAGLAFASDEQTAAWEDIGARREGAPAHGRRLVLRAAAAWGR